MSAESGLLLWAATSIRANVGRMSEETGGPPVDFLLTIAGWLEREAGQASRHCGDMQGVPDNLAVLTARAYLASNVDPES